MNTQNRLFGILLLLLVLTLGCTACSKDETNSPPDIEQDGDQDGVADQDDNCPTEAGPASNSGCPLDADGKIEVGDGISADSFETYPGDVGFILDTREIVKKGYVPTQAVVTVDATQGNYSQTITIDPISFMGQIKIPLSGMSEAAITELTNGVNLSSEIKDANGSTIISDPVATITFQANPNARTVNANSLEETIENATIKFNEGTFYYFQPIDSDGNPNPGVSMAQRAAGQDNALTVGSGAEFNGNEPVRNFSFVPIPGKVNTFAIRSRSGGRFIRGAYLTQTAPSISFFLFQHNGPQTSSVTDFSQIQNNPDFHFTFKKIDTGVYELLLDDNLPIRVAAGLGLTFDHEIEDLAGLTVITSTPITWRVISTSVNWQVQNVGTTFLEPILGAAQTGFQFNSTLTNCGQGSLSQTVGSALTETRTRTVGYEESLSINTTETVAISVTVGVEFDATFFGTGASYNMSVTTDFGYSRSVTESSSNFEEVTDEIMETIFSERTVTVPSGSASLVYDVFQYYEDTKVNFVQRLRISGDDSVSGMSLTGDEIRSQFQFSGFNGIILSVEPTSIVITLRGTTVLDKIVKAESKVEDVASNCGG